MALKQVLSSFSIILPTQFPNTVSKAKLPVQEKTKQMWGKKKKEMEGHRNEKDLFYKVTDVDMSFQGKDTSSQQCEFNVYN